MTTEELKTRKLELQAGIQAIEAQLGDANRTGTDGERLTDHEYWQWRQKANHAKRMISAELRDINRQLTDQQGSLTDVVLRIEQQLAHIIRLLERGE